MKTGTLLACAIVFAVGNARGERAKGMADSPWKLLPINGGGFIQNVQIAPSDPDVWYTYVDVGGPYRSDDAGRTWYPLHGNMSPALRRVWADHIRTLLVDPRDADRFVFAAGWHCHRAPAGVYVSRDGGRTFLRTLKARFHGEGPRKWTGKVLARDPAFPDRLLAATDSDGVFLSRDGGMSWETCGGDGYWFVHVAYDRFASGRVYACAPDFPDLKGTRKTGLLRSEDSGKTWRKVSDVAPFEMAQIAGSPEITGIFLIEGGTELRTSTDGGKTWHPCMDGLCTPTQAQTAGEPMRARYQAVAAGPDFLLVADWTGRLFRRASGTSAWRPVPLESMRLAHPEKEDGVIRSVARKIRECTSDIMIDPANPEHLLTTDWFHIWRSRDGGRNWTTSTDGIQQLVPFTIACDPHSPDNISYGCADMGMFNSQDGGRSFRKEHGICGANSIAWAVRTPHRGYAVGGKVGIQLMITTDGGRTWRYSKYKGLPPLGQKPGQRGIYTVAVDPSTDDVCLCVSGDVKPGGGGVYRSNDGGDTWMWHSEGMDYCDGYYKATEFAHGGPAHWPEQLVFSPDGSAVTYGPVNGKTYRLDRVTRKWVHVNVWNKGGRFTFAADPHVPGRFLMAADGRIVELTDGGRKINWELEGSQGLGYALAFDPFTPGWVVSASVDAEDVCVSRDGGRHWTCLPRGMEVPTGTQYRLVLDRKRLFMLTRGSGVWMRKLD